MGEDLKTAFRSLRHSRGFTVVALRVLALGIGAGTAIFSVVDAVVLRGLPFDEHDRLAVMMEKDTKHAVTFGEGSITPQTYLDWRQLQQPFQALTAIGGTQFRLKTEGGEPADARAQRVTPEFFPVLRVAPMLGRAFNAGDEVEGRHRITILTYGFWQRRFGGTTDVIGRTIDLNETTYEIVGGMPQAFSYPGGSDRPSELLVEGVVLALGGAALGIALASGGVAVLRAWLPAGLPRVASIAIDQRVLLMATAAAVLTGLVFGIAPALQSARPDLVGSLKEG